MRRVGIGGAALSPAADAEEVGIERLALRRGAMVAAEQHDVEAVLGRVQALLSLPASPDVLADDHAVCVAALRMAGDPDSAWAVGRAGLARLGLGVPRDVTVLRLLAPLARWRLGQWLRGRPAAAPRPGVETDPVTRLCDATATLAFEQSAITAAFLALEGRRRARPAAREGPFWLACDAFLCAMFGDFRRAAELGGRAVAILDARGPPPASAAASLYRAVFWGLVWRQSHAVLRPRCLQVRDMALASGDRVQAAIAIRNFVMIGWRTAPSLEMLSREIDEARDQLSRLGDHDSLSLVAALAAAVASLRTSPRPGADWSRSLAPGNSLLVMELANLHGDHAAALLAAAREPLLRRQLSSHPRGADWRFHFAVARLKTGRAPPTGDTRYLREAARLNPIDNGAKLAIVTALEAGGGGKALAAWAVALDAAEHGPSRLEAGLCAALAARAARAQGRQILAELLDDRARGIWRAWGARALLAPRNGDESPAAPLARRAADTLIAETVHELRTPLQALRAMLDLAGENPGALDIGSLRQGVANLAVLLDNLAPDAGRTGEGRRAPVDLPRLIERECLALRPLAVQAGRCLDWACERTAPGNVVTDGAGVAQVLRNLIANACKYGGRRILVRLAGDSRALALSVEDDGPGVATADLATIFSAGERGAHAGEPGGEGLGLAISRRLAERLGGALAAEPRHPRGLRFTLTLPHEMAEVAPPGAAGGRPEHRLRAGGG